MHVVARPVLIAFGEKHHDAKSPLSVWYTITRKANWKTPQDVKDVFTSASFLKNDVVVFEIGGKGKGYRLSAGINYRGMGHVYIRHIMTHPEYLLRSKTDTL